MSVRCQQIGRKSSIEAFKLQPVKRNTFEITDTGLTIIDMLAIVKVGRIPMNPGGEGQIEQGW